MISSAYINGFNAYLLLERKLSGNSIDAYLRDINKFNQYLHANYPELPLTEITLPHCQSFLESLAQLDIGPTSQARIVSGIKAFFRYLVLEKVIVQNPTQLLEAPKLRRKIPTVLSVNEIDLMLQVIDQSKPEGVRNKAIIETLYGCGLRVSELTNLQLSGLYFELGFIKVSGKGNKERLVPINQSAVKQINIYRSEIRNRLTIAKGQEDFVFLNRRGKQLSRVMIFTIVKNIAALAGIPKTVSPHTFRHSFATHLYEGGADLRVIQDMLGHESITTTEIYAKIDTQYLRDALIQFHPRF